MASVTLTGLWMHRADDLDTFVQVDALNDVQVDRQPNGEVVGLAGGRRVVRRRPGEAVRYAATVLVLDRGTLDLLEGWAGETVMVRDGRGEKLFGVVLAPSRATLRGGRGWTLTLPVDVTTDTEQV